jgi:hypothetical protein
MVRLAFAAIFSLTGLLTITVLGHAQGLLDWAAMISNVLGLFIAVVLGRRLQYSRPNLFLLILLALLILPLRLSFQVVAAIAA